MRANIWASVVAPTFLIVMVSTAFAQAPGSAQRGYVLATRLCVNCHLIDGRASDTVKTDVPSFATIANRAGATAEHLTGKIIVPHAAMPGVALTVEEVREIVAYILTLKRGD